MYVFMYVCMYVCIYVCIYIYISILYIYIYIYRYLDIKACDLNYCLSCSREQLGLSSAAAAPDNGEARSREARHMDLQASRT